MQTFPPKKARGAIAAVIGKYPDGIDCLICNAGVGPHSTTKGYLSLNFFAPVQLAEALRPLLKRKRELRHYILNSITNMTVRLDWVNMLINVMDEERVMDYALEIDSSCRHPVTVLPNMPLARWMRRVSASWAVDGLRINSVAPGNCHSYDTEYDRSTKDAALLIPIPTRYGRKEFLSVDEIANRNCVPCASPLASGINGVVLFIDGGIDALLQSNDSNRVFIAKE